MKICVTGKEDHALSMVEHEFCSCNYFIIYDTDLRDYKILQNTNKIKISAADIFKKIAYENVDVILTGNFDKKLLKLTYDHGIKIYKTGNMRAFEAIEKFLGNQLSTIYMK